MYKQDIVIAPGTAYQVPTMMMMLMMMLLMMMLLMRMMMRMMTMLMKFSKGCRDLSGRCKTSPFPPFPPQPSALDEWCIRSIIPIYWTGSLLALRAPTSRWRPFVFCILLALRSCDPQLQQWAESITTCSCGIFFVMRSSWSAGITCSIRLIIDLLSHSKNHIVPPSTCNAHAHPSNVCACALDAHP